MGSSGLERFPRILLVGRENWPKICWFLLHWGLSFQKQRDATGKEERRGGCEKGKVGRERGGEEREKEEEKEREGGRGKERGKEREREGEREGRMEGRKKREKGRGKDCTEWQWCCFPVNSGPGF